MTDRHPTQTENGQSEGLRREIGVVGTVLIVLNSLIGAGIYALPSSVAGSAGSLSPWLFLAVGLGVCTIVAAFSQLAGYFQHTGGPVLYTRSAFGPLISFQTGWLLYLGRVTALAANANLLADYAALICHDLLRPVLRAALITALCCVLLGANILGVRQGVRLMGILTILKIAPLIALIAAGIAHISPEALLPSTAVSNLGETALLLLYAFVGFEAALVTAGETRSPKTTIPRVLLPTVMVIAVVYCLIQVAYIGIQPSLDYSSKTPLVDLGTVLFGAAGAIIVTMAALFSISGNLAAIMVAAPRMTFAMAEGNALPKWFAGVNERFATPHNSLIFLWAIGLTLALSGSFVWLAAMSSLSRMLAYLASLMALPVIRRKQGESPIGKRDWYLAIACALCVWVMAQVSTKGWLTMMCFMAAGWVLYLFSRRNSRAQQAAAE